MGEPGFLPLMVITVFNSSILTHLSDFHKPSIPLLAFPDTLKLIPIRDRHAGESVSPKTPSFWCRLLKMHLRSLVTPVFQLKLKSSACKGFKVDTWVDSSQLLESWTISCLLRLLVSVTQSFNNLVTSEFESYKLEKIVLSFLTLKRWAYRLDPSSSMARVNLQKE